MNLNQFYNALFRLLIFYLSALLNYSIINGLECLNCQSEIKGLKCSEPCQGDRCVVWKWNSKSGALIRQGCISGLDEHFTAKVGCRTNYLGATLCLCNDGDLCNRAERAESSSRPLPHIQQPAVECKSKVTGTGMFGSKREHVCSANYCHMSKTENYEDSTAPDVLNVYNCGDIHEFDFDVRIKNSVNVPGLYVNGCYKIQTQLKETVTDCICSRNNCNHAVPTIVSGPVRCYIGQTYSNQSTTDSKEHFCDGDYCFIQKENGLYTKGCISVNERNSWSHITNGYRRILDVEQWLCQAHLCNFDIERATKIMQIPRSPWSRTNHANNLFFNYLLYCFVITGSQILFGSFI